MTALTRTEIDTTRSAVITLDDHVVKSYNEILRMHWSKRSKTEDAMETAVRCAVMPPLEPYRQRVDIGFTYIRQNRGIMDACNLPMKLYIDCLRRFGVLIDDNFRYIRRPTPEIQRGKGHRLVIEITPVGEILK